MYQSYEFTFAGMSSRMFQMMIYDIGEHKNGTSPFGNKANIVDDRLANRVRPIHYGVKYHEEPLTFNLIFGSTEELDRYELQEIAQWLTGYQEYQWLTIEQPDLENVRFKCLVQSLTPISIGWVPVAFEAKIVCDSPYAYGYPIEQSVDVDGNATIRLFNDGSARVPFLPFIEINAGAGCTELSIHNVTTGKKMNFTNLPQGGVSFTIDCENKIISDCSNEYDLYNNFNYQFLAIEPGDNNIQITGKASVKFSGSFWYNVGA